MGCWCVNILLLLPFCCGSAQFIEVIANIEVSWSRKGAVFLRTNTVRCVVGTNTWLLEGDFPANANETFWFTGTNIIRHTTITKRLPDTGRNRVHQFSSKVPEVGTEYGTVFDSDGGPMNQTGLENVAWLAFCSGKFFRAGGRKPLPIPVDPRAPYATNSLIFFEDSLQLPRRVEFYADLGDVLCQYDVQQVTNILGWSIPIQFQVVHNRQNTSGTWERHSQVIGRVTSLLPASPPVMVLDKNARKQ
ncbi:MAG: hypothetical protein QOF48_3298 [Verrucomicrobiota bacterium]|jgi:hypothetical protein